MPVRVRLARFFRKDLKLSECASRICKCCSSEFSTTNVELELCSSACVEMFFKVEQEELTRRKEAQLSFLPPPSCVVCGKAMQELTLRKTIKRYCSATCTLRAVPRDNKIERPCVHCNDPVLVHVTMRLDFVRCSKHRSLWPKIRLESAQNLKQTKEAAAPFDQYLLRGPWWDHKKRAWTVLLMHSGASSKREMEYARYLLSVKSGSRLSDSVPVVYVDGDRTNVEVSNLALG